MPDKLLAWLVHRVRPSSRWSPWIAAACLIRFAGVAVASTAMLGIVLWARGSPARRVLFSTAVGVIGVVPMLIWSAVTPVFRSFVYHPPPAAWWRVGLDTVSTWIAPPPLETRIGLLIGIAVTALLGARWLTSIARNDAEPRERARSTALPVCSQSLRRRTLLSSSSRGSYRMRPRASMTAVSSRSGSSSSCSP
jgi:hypothetical protein